MTNLKPIAASTFSGFSFMKHGFFTRQGGVSEGIYTSLNIGIGSDDLREHVIENRTRVAGYFDLPHQQLCTLHQIHSPDVLTLSEPTPLDQRPQGDAMVTATSGIILGILTADCTPLLFVDPVKKVIGAAHAGWGGAFKGIAEATITAMEALGASTHDIHVAIGPCIRQKSYETGPEFIERFLLQDTANKVFFTPSPKQGHHYFDLAGYLKKRLSVLGLASVEDTELDTCSDEERFFSFRRKTLSGEPDYGRQVSAICIA